MIELEKIYTLTTENPRNLGTHQMIKISSILRSTHMVFRDQDKFVFYVNHYIDWDQFKQLYDLEQIEKGVKNADKVARKLRPASTRATNQRLEVAKEKKRKKKKW